MKNRLLLMSILYPVVWIVGLLITIPDIAFDDSTTAIWQATHDNRALAMQSLLVHGVAGVLLIAIGTGIASLRNRDGYGRNMATAARWCGTIAGIISLVQFVLEQALILGWFGMSESNARSVWLAISRIDGVKMLALAGLVVGLGYTGLGRTTRFPWVQWLALVSAAALVVSGAGYIFLTTWALAAATVSLPLLLLSVIVSCVTEVRTNAQTPASERGPDHSGSGDAGRRVGI